MSNTNTQAGIARFFEVLAEEDDEIRAHMRVKLTSEQCAEVARVLREPVSLFECSPGDGEPTGQERERQLCAATDQRLARLDELERLDNEATRAPWKISVHAYSSRYDTWTSVDREGGMPGQVCRIMSSVRPDGEFIVALRNNAALLITEARDAEGLREELRERDREIARLHALLDGAHI